MSTKIKEFEIMKQLAKDHLPEEVFDHSVRVMMYVMCNGFIPAHLRDDCITVAIAHDLIEDTDLGFGDLAEMNISACVLEALELVTNYKGEEYISYIRSIREACGCDAGKIAFWVKLADMKDHLNQRETLTGKLEKKYSEALAVLLP